MAKSEKKVVEALVEVDTKAETIVSKKETVAVEEPTNTFADTLDLTVKISPTVAMAAQQAADRLVRDLANFPSLK